MLLNSGLQVTIFGASAGSQSVLFHLLSKKSRPYFKRAIAQSAPEYPYPNRVSANAITEVMISHFRLTFKCNILQNGYDCLR